MKDISNSFSPKMLSGKGAQIVTFKQISRETFDKKTEDAYSIIGHKGIAKLLNKPFNRETIHLKKGDELYIALSSRGRLEEGHGLQDSTYFMRCKI